MRSLHDYLTGGPVRGPGTATSDSILARLSNGEYVLPKVAVDQVGVQNLEAIRRAALAKTPKLALGGPISGGLNFQDEQDSAQTDAFGNDLSLTNRMNSGAEAMRTMREGPAAPATAQPQDDFVASLSKALQGNDPAKQAEEARKAAQAKADPLDVASGRFDREYAPGMAQGGLISQGQWERLPRFAEGTPYSSKFEKWMSETAAPAIDRFATGSLDRATQGASRGWNQSSGISAPFSAAKEAVKSVFNPGSPATPMPAATPLATTPPAATSAPLPKIPASGATTLPPAPSAPVGAVTTGAAISPGSVTPPAVPNLPAPIISDFVEGLADANTRGKALLPQLLKLDAIANANASRLAATDYANQSPGRAVINNAPGSGIGPQAVVAAPSRPIGTQSYTTGQPFEPSQGAPNLPPPATGSQRIMASNGVTGPMTVGGSLAPHYQTDYTVFGPKGQQGTLSVTGPDQRVGGGTVSQPDQGNGGTVEGNVAALNRQTEALRSLREARNPGITSGGSAAMATPASVDLWARPGDSFGDSQMRQARYEGLLKDAANQKGLGAKRRAAAMIDAATGLLAPGAATAKLNAEQQQAANSLAGQLAQARAQQEASKYGADVGLAGHKYTADATLAGSRLKAEQEAQQASRAATQKDNEISISAYRARTEADRVKKEMAGLSTAEKNQAILRLADRLSQLPKNSPEAINIRTVLQYLQPSSNQDDALAATEALVKAQAAAK